MKSRIKTILTFLLYAIIIFSFLAIKGAMSNKRHTRGIQQRATSYGAPKQTQSVPPLRVEDLPSRRGNNDTGS